MVSKLTLDLLRRPYTVVDGKVKKGGEIEHIPVAGKDELLVGLLCSNRLL